MNGKNRSVRGKHGADGGKKKAVSPLRQRMLDDMKLAGLATKTKRLYICAVKSIQQHYHGKSPDRLTEKQVYDYILWMRDVKENALGTFLTHFYGLKFFYYRCLGYRWHLFTTKRVRQPRRFRLPVPVYPEQARAIVAGLRSLQYRVFTSYFV